MPVGPNPLSVDSRMYLSAVHSDLGRDYQHCMIAFNMACSGGKHHFFLGQCVEALPEPALVIESSDCHSKRAPDAQVAAGASRRCACAACESDGFACCAVCMPLMVPPLQQWGGNNHLSVVAPPSSPTWSSKRGMRSPTAPETQADRRDLWQISKDQVCYSSTASTGMAVVDGISLAVLAYELHVKL